MGNRVPTLTSFLPLLIVGILSLPSVMGLEGEITISENNIIMEIDESIRLLNESPILWYDNETNFQFWETDNETGVQIEIQNKNKYELELIDSKDDRDYPVYLCSFWEIPEYEEDFKVNISFCEFYPHSYKIAELKPKQKTNFYISDVINGTNAFSIWVGKGAGGGGGIPTCEGANIAHGQINQSTKLGEAFRMRLRMDYVGSSSVGCVAGWLEWQEYNLNDQWRRIQTDYNENFSFSCSGDTCYQNPVVFGTNYDRYPVCEQTGNINTRGYGYYTLSGRGYYIYSGTINHECYDNITSLYASQLEMDNLSLTKNIYVLALNKSFNTSNQNTNIGIFHAFNTAKLTGALTNQIWVKTTIDNNIINEELVRTVSGTIGSGVGAGSTGQRPMMFNVSNGTHEIAIYYRRTGNGENEITNHDLVLVLDETPKGNVTGQFINLRYDHNNTNYFNAYNFTTNNNKESDIFIAGKFSLNSSNTNKGSYFYKDLVNGMNSSLWERYLPSSSSVGSVLGMYIQKMNKTRNISMMSKTDNNNYVTVNGSLVEINLMDNYNNEINNFYYTNPKTNVTNEIEYGEGNKLLANNTIEIEHGNSIFVAYSVTFKSTIDDFTPKFIISSPDITNEYCYSYKERYSKVNEYEGNVFSGVICRNVIVGNVYDIELHVIIETGNKINVTDESLIAFETTWFNYAEGVIYPEATGSSIVIWFMFGGLMILCFSLCGGFGKSR